MVSVGVSSLGKTSIHFFDPGAKIDGRYYRSVLLVESPLPDIRGLRHSSRIWLRHIELE